MASTSVLSAPPATSAAPWHALEPGLVEQRLAADAREGLVEGEALRRRAVHGLNQLAPPRPEPLLRRFLAQFRQLVILILIAAAVVAGALGEVADTLAILAIVLLNGLLGFVQEERAGRALAALRKLSAPLARTVRGGVTQKIAVAELVPGDLVELEAGDIVPADARLVEAHALRLQEAALTGESEPVEKDAGASVAERAARGDRRTMVYMGTTVVAGRGRALVTATGMTTELGRIAGALAGEPQEPTPLQRRLAELGRVLVVLCLVLVALVFALELLRGGSLLEVLLTSVSLAVAAVPEGLPAVVTVALALGLRRMVRRNALIRKLPSVETLGCVTVICTDKTGTLTTAFCVLVYAQLLLALAARSRSIPLLRLGLLGNPQLIAALAISALLQASIVTLPFARPWFETVAHPAWEWALVGVLAVVPLLVIEAGKGLRARRARIERAP